MDDAKSNTHLNVKNVGSQQTENIQPESVSVNALQQAINGDGS